MSLKKTLRKKNEEGRVIMPLLNKVLYFLFLYRDHLVFLESSFWFLKQLVRYWKAQNISSDCLPVSMIKEVTSDFLSCGTQKLGGVSEAFFFPFPFSYFIGGWSKFLWKSVESPAADPWLLSLWCHWHWWLLSSELIVDLKHFTWNFTFNSKSLCFTVIILSACGRSFKSSVSPLDFSKFFLAMGVLNHIYLCYDHMLVCNYPVVSSF